ncbi:MAG: NADH-quinone oxidoreductase subunit NuoK [Planctomycetales bacterium]
MTELSDVAELNNYLLVSALLFSIGMAGFLARRNLIVMFLGVEMMLQAVALNLAAFSWYHNDWGGQMLVIFIITVAACEAAIALALIMMLFHHSGSLDVAFWQSAREDVVPARVDRELPEEAAPETVWPSLAPAGVRPEPTEEETPETEHVRVR